MNKKIDYNEKGFSRSLYFAFTLKGIYHPDLFTAEKIEADIEKNTPEHKGTRKPGNRGDRRKATEKAKQHLREIYPLTDAVKQTGNGGYIHKGNTYEWHPVWKKIDKRLERHSGKEICRNYVEDETNIWEFFDYYERCTFPEREDGTIDLDMILDDDEEYEDDVDYFVTHRYWSNEINDHVYETYPNYEYAEQFLREIGLENQFINWLKNKEKIALTRRLCR